MRHTLRRWARNRSAATCWHCSLPFLLFVTSFLLAQPAPHFGHQAWTTEDGLPQNSVHQVLQTRDGYLWIATEAGLARFDGLSFTVFRHDDQPQFPSDDIACLAEDSHGALWIGTTDGLVQFADGHFTRIALGNLTGPPSILALAAATDGAMLALSPDGLTRLVAGHTSPFPNSPAIIETLTQAPDGNPWLTAGAHLFQYTNGKLEDRGALSHPGPLSIEVDRKQSVWARSLTAITRNTRDPHGLWQPTSTIPLPLINTFFFDDTSAPGALWLGTKRGLFLLSPDIGKLLSIEAIGERSVLSIARDREGNLWVGTEADGLHILRAQKVQAVPDLADHLLTSLTQTTDGAVWIGTRDDGLRVYKSATRTATIPAAANRPSLATPLASPLVLALAAGRHNDLWVGTLDGLAHVYGTQVERFSSADGLPDDVIRSLLVDDNGALWIGTRRGLVHWSGTRGAPFVRIPGLPSDLIGAMLRSQHGPDATGHPLWVATLDGLSRISGDDAHPITTSYKFGSGTEATVITSLAEDPAGTLWIGTRDHGLAAMTATGIHPLPPAGLPKLINSLLADTRGHLWLGTPAGIFRVATDDLRPCLTVATCTAPVARFGYADGMPTEETTATGHPAALLTRDGTLWFATAKGAATLHPSTMQQIATPPPVVIDRFLVDNVVQPLASPQTQLPFGHNSLIFDYVGLSFAAPSRVRYRYLLQGFDKDWTNAGSRRTAFYTNLPPGPFVFRVQAVNSDGVWNRTGAQLAFTIRPPFYRRSWFYLLVILVLASIAYGIYYLRVRRLRSEFDAVLAERSRLAREIHDTLAQNFVGISIQLQIVDQLLAAKNLAATSDQLQQTRALVQEGLNDARQSIWELRASVAEDSLPTRISRAAERSTRNGVSPNVTIGGIYRLLDAAVEKEILRIAGEALANISRHAHATEINVDLRYEAERLHLAVMDNGKGFDPDAVSSTGDHFGLRGMRERAAGLAATLSVTSSLGEGTTIRLAVPLPRSERRSQ